METYRLKEAGVYLTEGEIEREYNAFKHEMEYPSFEALVESGDFIEIKSDWFIARTCDDIYIGEYDTLKEAKEAVKELEEEDRENGEYSRDAYKILPTNDAQLYMIIDDHTTHGAPESDRYYEGEIIRRWK